MQSSARTRYDRTTLEQIASQYEKLLIKHDRSLTPDEFNTLMTIPEAIEDMALGKMVGQTLVNNARVGLGKTTMLKVCVPILAKAYPKAGFLIIVPSIQNTLDLARSLEASGSKVCIYGSDSSYVDEDGNYNETIKRGNKLVKDALKSKFKNSQIMVTTASMMTTRQKQMASFGSSVDFSWDWSKKSRPIIIWDEKASWYQATSSTESILKSLYAIFENINEKEGFLFDVVDKLEINRDRILDGNPEILDALSDYRGKGNDVRDQVLKGTSKELGSLAADAVRNLLCWEGGKVLIEGIAKKRVYGVIRTLTPDFGENGMLVLDASASINPTYDHVEHLTHVRNVPRDYSHVEVHWLQTRSGTEAWKDAWHAETIHKAVKAVTKDNHKYLVVGRREADHQKAAYLDQSHYMYWGSSDAVGSNDFTSYNGFVAMCLPQIPARANQLAYAAARMGTDVSELPPEDFSNRLVMMRLHQAIGRGSVRITAQKPDPYHVVIVAGKRSKVDQMLKSEFPNCKINVVEVDNDKPRKVKEVTVASTKAKAKATKADNDKKAIGRLFELLMNSETDSIPKSEAYAIKSREVWKRLKDHEDMIFYRIDWDSDYRSVKLKPK